MANTGTGGLSRITIVAPRSRVDLAIPANVPLAHLLPTLLRAAGADLADHGATQSGWVLSRLGGPPLDPNGTPTQLDVRDGEILYFTTRGNAPAVLAYDDVADAVATAAAERAGLWQLSTTRRTSLTIAGIALTGGAATIAFLGTPLWTSGLAGLLIGLILVATAATLHRLARARRAGLLFSMVSLGYAGVGGLLILGEGTSLSTIGAAHVLLAAATIVTYSALLVLATGGATALLGTTAAGAVIAAGAAITALGGATAAGSTAIITAIALGTLPFTPIVAARVARLPFPSVPASPDELKADEATIDGHAVRRQADRAGRILAALLTAAAAVFLAAEVVFTLDDTLPATIFCALLGVILLLRARPYRSRAQRMPILVAGFVGLGLTAVRVFLDTTPVVRLTVVVGGLIIIAVVAMTYGLVLASRKIAPIWGRALDIIEVILILGAVPMAFWVSGMYAWVRALRP